MITDKANMLCLLKVLQEYSDANHILSMSEIKEKLHAEYDIKPDRRTIYGAIDALEDLGYDISRYEENGIGYYLRERIFDSSEIRLLLDAVYNCSYITPQQTLELLDKIRGFVSVHERKKYSYANIVNPEKKSPNQEVFLNIETLDEAINDRKQIEFTYLKYDAEKKLVPRREEKYIANPYAMICENEHYYLILTMHNHKEPAFYRIDMMKDIKILDSNLSISKRDAKLDSIKRVVYAYSGEPVQVELLCDEIGLRYCIEKFGKNIIITPAEDKFSILLNAPMQGMLFWALQYMQHVEVKAPIELRNQIKQVIKESNY